MHTQVLHSGTSHQILLLFNREVLRKQGPELALLTEQYSGGALGQWPEVYPNVLQHPPCRHIQTAPNIHTSPHFRSSPHLRTWVSSEALMAAHIRRTSSASARASEAEPIALRRPMTWRQYKANFL